MTTISRQKSILLKQFNETRTRTLNLVQTLEKDDFVVQTAPFMSPPKWHLGHVSWLLEVVMSKTINDYEFYSQEFSEYLNSYYHQFGEPHDKDKRGLATRPTIDQVFEYFHMITNKVTSILQNEMLDEKIQQLFFMAINHECQHQELLVYDLQHLLADRYRPLTKILCQHHRCRNLHLSKLMAVCISWDIREISFAMILSYLNTKCILMTTKLTHIQLQTNNT